MNTFIRKTTLAALLLAAIPAANAAIQNFSFSGMLDSGTYSGQSFTGSFSFDDAGLLGVDSEWLSVGKLTMSFLGSNFTEANATAPVEAGYYNGNFVGLSYDVGAPDNGFTMIPGYDSISQAFLAYTTAGGQPGAGSVIYATVPEPETYALMLTGLGLLGYAARRRKRII